MKALTVKQPWAGAIVAGVKRVENRTRRTNHVGPLVIHAGKAIDDDAAFVAAHGLGPWGPHVPEVFGEEFGEGPTTETLPWALPQSRGLLLGMVDLVGCHHEAECDLSCGGEPWAQDTGAPRGDERGIWHWVVEHPRRFTRPLAWKGMLGLWTLPDELLADLGPVS